MLNEACQVWQPVVRHDMSPIGHHISSATQATIQRLDEYVSPSISVCYGKRANLFFGANTPAS